MYGQTNYVPQRSRNLKSKFTRRYIDGTVDEEVHTQRAPQNFSKAAPKVNLRQFMT
jgi:hypothetical protein